MPARKKPDLKPRREPRQARSQVTVEAIFEATIQVLLTEGLQRLTTIRVAERAGVSVGTLYQYFPNKQALLLGVLQRHLKRVGECVGHAAAQVHHKPLAVMMPAVIDAFVAAKTDRIDEARALALVADQLESKDVVHAAAKRGRTVLTDLLETATDARFEDAGLVAFFLTSALIGAVRVVVEGGAPQKAVRALRGQLASLCLGYLEREAGGVGR
jgi:AcrR family transcriptional regulator